MSHELLLFVSHGLVFRLTFDDFGCPVSGEVRDCLTLHPKPARDVGKKFLVREFSSPTGNAIELYFHFGCISIAFHLALIFG